MPLACCTRPATWGSAFPQQLAVAGFDDLPYSATSNPSITSVQLNAQEGGKRQAALKLRALLDGKTPDRTAEHAAKFVDCWWVDTEQQRKLTSEHA